MLTNSHDIKRRLERDGWILRQVRGSHHVFKKAGKPLVPPPPKKDSGKGLVHAIYTQAGWQPD